MQIEIQTDEDPAALAARFPAFSIRVVDALAPGAWTADAWRAHELDFWAFDRALDELAARGEPLRIAAPIAIAREILTRAQRLAPRTNADSAAPWFARVRDAHTALHDVSKPLVRADLDHAIDTWQWTLRLDPDARASVQLAALLHDVERLRSEADARVEHTAADYQAFKDAHARAGASIARALLEGAGVPDPIARDAAALIAIHERRADDPAIALVGDADALSFFSLNAAGYLRYFGPAQTAKKVAYTLARMSPRARAELPFLRLPHDLHLA
jgi:hypothetical protein